MVLPICFRGKKTFFFFRVGSNKHNGLYLTGLIKDFASNSVETGKKKKKGLVHLIFPKAKISLRSSWKERGEKETKIKKRSLFEA